LNNNKKLSSCIFLALFILFWREVPLLCVSVVVVF
jgi:hypothetical protein